MKALVYSTQKARFYAIAARLVRHARHIIFPIAGVNCGRSYMKTINHAWLFGIVPKGVDLVKMHSG